MTRSRYVILGKAINDKCILGFYLKEECIKNKLRLTIKQVEGDKTTNTVKYLKTIKKEDMTATEFINMLDGFKIVNDEITEYNNDKKGFRVIDNLSSKIIASYNWN